MRTPPPILTIAGSDSSGGAGIQADLKTIQALGGYGMSAITALTAQNTLGVQAVHPVPANFVAKQITSILDDIPPSTIKTGMLANAEIIEAVTNIITPPACGGGRGGKLPSDGPNDGSVSVAIPPLTSPPQAGGIDLVIDPVMIAKGGASLLEDDAITALKDQLIPLATLLTPNIPEAEELSGIIIHTIDDMERAAKQLLTLGPKAVLIKGGHLDTADQVHNLLLTQGGTPDLFTSKRIDTPHTHGTGCTLSAAIATYLGHGESLASACKHAESYVTGAITNAPGLGHGHGPLGHDHNIK